MQNLYKITFWIGYTTMLIMAFLPSGGNLSGKNVATVRLDYLLHFAVYMAICLYFMIGWMNGLNLFRRNSFVKFVIVIILLASATELIQLAVPSRAFNIRDWVANLTGIAGGLLVFSGLRMLYPGVKTPFKKDPV